MPADRLKIVICGGGLAGFAAALLLREDHDITILESSMQNEETGAAITLSMNATRILRSSMKRAGFDAARSRYVEAEKFQEVNYKDLSIISDRKMAYVTNKYGEPWWYFSRRDVHAEFKRAALSPAGLGSVPELRLGARVVSVDSESGEVTLENGEIVRGDVVIGADGIRSATGNCVFGALGSSSQGLSAYRCMIPTARIRADPETAMLVDGAKVLMFIGPDRRIVAYPCSSWEWINFVGIFPDSSDRRVQWNNKVPVETMLDRFGDFHPSILKALSMADEVGVWQLRDREPLQTWTRGCFALIGDAAHAMGPHQGQGACQAVEDAEALRIAFKNASKGEILARLRVFDEVRVPRATRAMEYTRNAAPSSTQIQPKSTMDYSDWYWSYKVAEESVRAMQKAGYKMTLEDATTGAVSLHI
ncbi:Kynurenine 3-monooxygenase [Sphaceloma murrayae]|uniref:Kynurenine 3-monooxygenase n=1 Tax=Sphaceloma murrayae TaxID=2082308 RepID=A0A2K1QWY9_9PEZI|nr:Kynurenine 3-monooxygenase [Sphaceloma murrayae]